jgi:hypothetical protein
MPEVEDKNAAIPEVGHAEMRICGIDLACLTAKEVHHCLQRQSVDVELRQHHGQRSDESRLDERGLGHRVSGLS